jgi:flagellar motor protein MotB
MQYPEMSAVSGETESASSAGQHGNDMLFLALYLILLAFFILLNANANLSERKTQAVIAAFQPAFVVPQIQADATSLTASMIETRLLEVFRNHLPSGEWQLQTLEGRIELSLPLHRAFPKSSAVLQPGRISLVRQIGSIVGDAQEDSGVFVLLMIGGTDQALARRRTAALARDLVRSGIVANRFEAGTDSAAAETISIRLVHNASETDR